MNLIDKEINALYSEEKRILHLKQLELEHKRSHTFLRIQHYYESANRLNSNISIMLYNEDDLFRYTGLDFKALNDSFLERLKTVEEELEYEDK